MTATSFPAADPSAVDQLLAQLTLEQKIGQMIQAERMAITPDEVAEFHIGSVLSGGGSAPGANRAADWIAMNDAYWAASMREGPGRVPIPLVYGVDAVHGNNNVLGATVFPHNIGLGAANDPDLVERIARATAREILATGVDWTFAPTLAVARDPRWGRTYESYSDDPERVVRYAGPFVRGLQDGGSADGVIACAKHWVGDGGTTDGHDQGNTVATEEELERVHIAPYLPALEAGVLTVMASFNSWNGAKCHGHRYLLTDVLKGRLGFDGFIVSDWDGVEYLDEDLGTAIAMAVNAGVDMLMISVEWRRYIELLLANVRAGLIPMARIDDAVRRILSVKQRSGLLARPRPAERPWSQVDALGAPAHRALAREAVRASLVLLQHTGGVLPVSPAARVLVAGKNAHDRGHQCGGFTVAWQGTSGSDAIIGGTSIWEGIREVAPHAELSVTGDSADASRHDVAIVVIGERPYAEGMGDIRPDPTVARGSSPAGRTSQLAPYGQSLTLADLHPEDLTTIRRIAERGVPVVAVLVSGRPLAIDAELAHTAAFIAAWLPGSEGQGVADVLFGAHPFTGTLPMRWRNAQGEWPRGYGLR
jgi:beta-glucosidase